MDWESSLYENQPILNRDGTMALELVLQILLEGNNWSSHKASIFDHHRHPGDIFFPVIYHFLGFSQVLQVGKTIGFFQVCCVQSNQSYGTNFREDLLIISTWGENFTWTDNALLPVNHWWQACLSRSTDCLNFRRQSCWMSQCVQPGILWKWSSKPTTMIF